MLNCKIFGLIIMVLFPASSWAQEGPVSGFYQIISGSYRECYEVFGNPFVYSLPDTNQSYVELAVDAQRNTVQMAILGQDRHTVFASSGFRFFFTNGVVFPDHVQFGGEIHVPEVPAWIDYTVSNSAAGLRIDGYFEGPTGPTDVPTRFEHTNIVAVLVAAVPIATLSLPRVFGGVIQFTVFNGQADQTNVVEASTDLVRWTAISTNVFPSTVCPICPFIDFQDPVSANLARRYYRTFSLP